jgi:N-acetyl-alpha-D-muramate 1-phosphate uridylyltransferase
VKSNTLPSVAILAGGLATRLRPMSGRTPKVLLTIAGEPFISHQLKELSKNGIQKVVLCVGYLGEEIESFVGDGSSFGLKVHYSYDGETLLGTGGAIRRALPLLGEFFFVLYGDSWLRINYHHFWSVFQNVNTVSMMSIFKNEGRWDSSNVEMQNSQILLYSKTERNERMNYIDYGLSIFKKSVFEKWGKNKQFDLGAVFALLSRRKCLAAYEAPHRFYEIGSFGGLKELEEYFFNLNTQKE